MIVSLDLAIFMILLLTALLALRVRDLLTAVALLAGYTLFASLLFTGVSALDVALVEAALGAGITGVLLIAAILATTRRSTASESRRQRGFVLVLIAAFLGLMLFASIDLPDRGDPEAAAHVGISTAYLEGSLEDTETPNVVTALLADYRSMDTLGETLVILTAAIAAALVLIRRPEDEGEPAAAAEDDGDPAATAEDEGDPVTGREEGS